MGPVYYWRQDWFVLVAEKNDIFKLTSTDAIEEDISGEKIENYSIFFNVNSKVVISAIVPLKLIVL